MLHVRFVAAAREELVEAVRWYRDEAGAERAAHFRDAIRRAVTRAARFPLSARVVARVEGMELRGFVTTDYPYVVITGATRTDLLVFAVAHQRREPGYWRPRLASVKP